MSLKNIIVVSDYAYPEGGATNVAIQTALLLSKFSDYNIHFFSGSGDICNELKSSKVKYVSLNIPDILHNKNRLSAIKNGIYNKKVERDFYTYLKNFLPSETIIHVHTWTKVLSSAVFKVSCLLGFKVVLTLHDYFITCPNGGCLNYKNNNICTFKPLSLNCLCSNCDSRNYFHKIWRVFRQYKQNSIFSKCNNISYIFVSEFQKKEILKRSTLHGKQSTLINCVNTDAKERVCAENNELFLFIGRVSKEKGVELFCDAVTKTNVKAVVIGDGPIKKDLEVEYPNILFTGWLNKTDIEKWIYKARCLIFTSVLFECCPLTILEVQSHGIPCIVSNNCAARDFVVNNVSGVVSEPSSNDFAKSIELFSDSSLVKKLSINTFNDFYKNIRDQFTYTKKLLIIYKGAFN